jgi:asparagine synthase (glutamine-hydrolysing)
MGQKPLYVADGRRRIVDAIAAAAPNDLDSLEDQNPFVAFASEIPALRAGPGVVDGWEEEGLGAYLRWGYGMGFRNVGELAPGTVMKYWTCGKHWPGGGRYFDPNHAGEGSVADEQAVVETRRRVSVAVKRQLVSDVPLGVFLSGGIDSSVIACAARQHGAVQTFSIAFDDPRYDESAYAARVAQHLGTHHHIFRVRPDAVEDLPKLAAVFGEPFADSSALPTHYLARETRRHVKVALSGDGGDELFGGYDRYRAMRMGERLVRLPAIVRSMAMSRLWNVAGGSHPKSRRARVKRLLATIHDAPAKRYAGYVGLFDDQLLGELLGRPPATDNALMTTFESFRTGGRDVVRAALAVDRVTYLPQDLLTKVDRASMLHALEVRSPFMDPDVVTFAAGLTTDQLLRGGPKRMLREAFAADLPDFVFIRRKMGFAVPLGDWFRGELRPMLRDHLFAADSFARQHFDMATVERLVEEHEQSRVDHSQRLYALLMLELWHHIQKPRP